ncbi:unnamed protein product [Prorocentrum cordatum]|uniref:Uncharacterized protein n=1 Tax=Prorocentrum cordatum TaxID=2364126 RepID=A0ABN9TX57_9DINO|nr:unnamed protein product [Polarella glacialis]
MYHCVAVHSTVSLRLLAGGHRGSAKHLEPSCDQSTLLSRHKLAPSTSEALRGERLVCKSATECLLLWHGAHQPTCNNSAVPHISSLNWGESLELANCGKTATSSTSILAKHGLALPKACNNTNRSGFCMWACASGVSKRYNRTRRINFR